MKKLDVLVIGRSCLDTIAVINRFPKENEKTPLESRLMEGGGQGGTAACCVARLGGRVAYLGKLGNDPEGQFCLKRLQDFGVNTDHVEIVPGGKTPVAYLFVTKVTGARTIIYELNRLPKIAITPDLRPLLEQSAVILLDPETTYLSKKLKHLKDKKFKIVYDCETRREGLEEMKALADYFIPSMDFLREDHSGFRGSSVQQKIFRLKEMIGGELIVTDGPNGAYVLSEGHLVQVRPPQITVVDTTGAGDNFHGAFALAIAKGFEMTRAVQLAVAVASLSCRDYGGRQGLPNWNEAITVADRLKSIRL
jgi:sugar/nucleoside kinase (ribokinase family)